MHHHLGRFRLLPALFVALPLFVCVPTCGTPGRNMQAREEGATAPTRRPDVTTTTGAGVNTLVPSDLFTLTSSAFAPNGPIPTEYSCDGAGTSPPFTWAHVPAGTVELVLLISDPE